MKRGKVVIIEGTSCVGKTTLCNLLKNNGWVVIPEAIRYLEKETNKIEDEASPLPDSQEEEEYYQDQLFRIELQKIIDANKLSKEGFNVVLDKSAIAIIATAKAFEKAKNFNGTFKRACNCYYDMLEYLKNNNMIECDMFLLLTSNYETIVKRNSTRNHILEGIWIEKETIRNQQAVLEMTIDNYINAYKLDTTNLSKYEVLRNFYEIIEKLNINPEKVKGVNL